MFFFLFVNNIIGDRMKKILITGASSGIAASIINKIKDINEYYIYVTVRTNKQLELVHKKYKNNKNIECFKLDITNEEDINKVKELDIDILINNAAIGEGGSVACIDINRLINNLDEDDKEDIEEIINDSNDLINKHTKEIKMFINTIYKELKHYIKKYGHFTLVDIESEDSKIKIII